jgi:membrane protease YdiL (CAAX protease family)
LLTDAYLAFVIFGAVGVGTWRLDQFLRLTFMWLTLLALTLVYGSGRRIQVAYNYSDVGRGVVAGILISLPVVLLARDFLYATSQRLFPMNAPLTLFWGLVLIMPVVEALYFRGFLQREKGLLSAVLLYAGTAALYLLPATLGEHLPVLVAFVAALGLLGFVYAYLYSMYGFAASLACQATVHFVLFILPLLPSELGRLPI